MRTQKSIVRKAEKAKAIRKDFKKKNNVLRNNKPNNRFMLLTQGGGILPKTKKVISRKELRTK